VKFTFVHNNINVYDLAKSLAFYREALGLTETDRIAPPDGSFVIAFLGDGASVHRLELTWLKSRTEPYDLGDNEIHLALKVDDFQAAHQHHQKMACICYENAAMGLYFINDPDGYWIEILPAR
jgi:lactoylglutathione lyase